MFVCPNCGTQTDGKFCPKCGTATVAQVQPVSYAAPAPAAQPRAITKEDLPEQYKPLSAWAYWGLSILYAVPIVGFVFLIINSFNSSNINRRSFTRSYWINTIIAVTIIIILVAIVGFAGMADRISEFVKSLKIY